MKHHSHLGVYYLNQNTLIQLFITNLFFDYFLLKMNRYSLLVFISVCILTRFTPIHAQEFIEDDEKISIYNRLKQSSSNWFNGFESSLEGKTIKYTSGNPDATHALISRANSGKMSISWETSKVSTLSSNGYTHFVWLAGINCNTSEQPFDLSVNGNKILTFTTRFSKEWTQKGHQNNALKFVTLYQDSNGDLFGYMILTVANNLIESNQKSTITITGHPKQSNNWMMVFEYSKSLDDFKNAPKMGFFTISDEDLEWPDQIQNMPALTTSKNEKVWMAVTERKAFESSIAVYKINHNKQQLVHRFQLKNQTGIGKPVIRAFNNYCAVFFPVEIDKKWTIAYSFINTKNFEISEVQTLKTKGSSNINLSISALNNTIFVSWESNAGNSRGIYTCTVSPFKQGTIQRISNFEFNSYNPAIIKKNDEELFLAWDAYVNNTADIWGAKFKQGRWSKPFRITSDPRIERHPALAVKDNKIWMAWQAQSYGTHLIENSSHKNVRLNHIDEQRIVVAQLDDEALYTPNDLFTSVSTENSLYLRPKIDFTNSGDLLLTAREPINNHDGWYGVYWLYNKTKWSTKKITHKHRGRWNPISISPTKNHVYLASQYDANPKNGGQKTFTGDWKSAIHITTIPNHSKKTNSTLKTSKLVMPKTSFSLAEKTKLVSASFPRKEIIHEQDTLKLYFGDFHEHTVVSKCARKSNPESHDLFANLRDIEQLDFCAITDHHDSVDKPTWAYNSEQTRTNHDDKTFITYLGQEWSSSVGPNSFGYGHHNFIYLDPFLKAYINPNESYLTPTALWNRLEGHDFICIPHQLADWGDLMLSGGAWGNPPKDWNYYNEKLQPVAEIFQERGSYEAFQGPRQAKDGAPVARFYLQDAWKRKIIIGVIASPDHGGGSGKMGVWAKDLSRESIFKAIQSRHTYGTTGSKMKLFFSSNQAIMGDKIEYDSQSHKIQPNFVFEVSAETITKIKELVIFRNNRIIHKIEPNKTNLEIKWQDEAPLNEDFVWYYVRIHTVDDELAWSSPIWFIKS